MKTPARIAVLITIGLTGACGDHSSPAPHVAPAARPAADVSEARIVDSAKEPDQWLTTGRSYNEERFSPLAKIDEKNVGTLGLAWEFKTGSLRGLEATPLVIDGVMYTSGIWNVVYALDARTGKLLWTTDPNVDRQWSRNMCCDVVNRGLAAWKGRLYMGTLDGRLVSLDAATGKIDWDVNTRIDATTPYSITGAPRVVDGKVIIGNGGSDLPVPVRGYVSAYDAQTGKLAWRFFTVPGGPNAPFEDEAQEKAAKSWDPTGIFGGGTAWDSMAYDPALKLLYVGVGNGSPWASYRRSPKGGDNLYLASIVALQVETGKLQWYYQTTPGESWDYTATQHMILATLNLNGAPRDVLMQAPKNGFFYVLDRKTGELLSAKPYTTVTWASGVDLKTGRPNFTGSADYRERPALVYPSAAGGHNWHPMSYSLDTGLVYIPSMDAGWAYSNRDDEVSWYLGGVRETPAQLKGRLKGAVPKKYGGYLRAWDPVKQQLAWEVYLGGMWNGGVLSTAGDLVFQGTGSGQFNVYDARDGRKLKSIDVGTGIMAAPVAYAIDGEQFIAVLAGFGGGQMPAYEKDSAASRYVNEGRVLAFHLGGGPVRKPELLPARTVPEPPADAPAHGSADGKFLYSAYCGYCHGDHGMVGMLPDLRALTAEKHKIFNQIVLEGALTPNGMSSFAGVLNQEQVDGIHAYLINEQRRLWAEQQRRAASGEPAPTPELVQ